MMGVGVEQVWSVNRKGGLYTALTRDFTRVHNDFSCRGKFTGRSTGLAFTVSVQVR